MDHWTTIGDYTLGCPFGPFIAACRDWANGEAASPEEVFAVAYGYAMRQLKYARTDPDMHCAPDLTESRTA
jgi:hypothetical protein